MAYLKNWTDNYLQMFFMGTSWVAVSINNAGMGRGEVFAISDCLVIITIIIIIITFIICIIINIIIIIFIIIIIQAFIAFSFQETPPMVRYCKIRRNIEMLNMCMVKDQQQCL